MAYIGKKVEETELANRTVDTMTGDGSDTTMSLSATPISVNNVLVFFNGVMQRPTTDFTLSGSTITFGAAPFTGAVVVAITGEGGHIGRPSSPLTTEKFMDSAVTNAKLMSGIASSKLTGAMPALDGSALTGGGTGYTENASDPATTTNPSGGVGTFWVNTTSGETFCLTDATSNKNVWINIGGGSGDIEKDHQGTQHGYQAGGYTGSDSNVIDKFSFTSDADSTDHSDMVSARHAMVGSQDITHGYISGGNGNSNIIERIPFATTTNSVSVGTLTAGKSSLAGHSSFTHGYVSGGFGAAQGDNGINVIEKYAFASSGNGSDIANLTNSRLSNSGVMSLTHGYSSGGRATASITRNNIIDRFPFASDSDATDVGDLEAIGSNFGFNGQHSLTHGYCTGGEHIVGNASNPANGTRIQKFSFAASANATNVGTLPVAISATTGCSSTTHGYAAGGGEGTFNQIQKFSLSSDGNATDIANITVSRGNSAGLSN